MLLVIILSLCRRLYIPTCYIIPGGIFKCCHHVPGDEWAFPPVHPSLRSDPCGKQLTKGCCTANWNRRPLGTQMWLFSKVAAPKVPYTKKRYYYFPPWHQYRTHFSWAWTFDGKNSLFCQEKEVRPPVCLPVQLPTEYYSGTKFPPPVRTEMLIFEMFLWSRNRSGYSITRNRNNNR